MLCDTSGSYNSQFGAPPPLPPPGAWGGAVGASRPAALAPEIFPQRSWLLVTSGKLSAARQRQIELWQQQVVSLEVIPL